MITGKENKVPDGFERKEIRFLVVLRPDGDFVRIDDIREPRGRRLVGRIFVVPRTIIHPGKESYKIANFLWDHIGYLFGEPAGDGKSSLRHNAWLKMLEALPDSLKQDEGVSAVLLFYRNNGVEKVKMSPLWSECIKIPECNMTFQLVGDSVPVTSRPAVVDYWSRVRGKGLGA